jgi:hypothetical protein
MTSFFVTILLNATWGSLRCRTASAEIKLRCRLFAGRKVAVCLRLAGSGGTAGNSVRGVAKVSNCPNVGAFSRVDLATFLVPEFVANNVAWLEWRHDHRERRSQF